MEVDYQAVDVPAMEILKSDRLTHLKYDIRGPIYEKCL